jgi:hypothetical protein
MKKYQVYVQYNATEYLGVVEANTEDEAKDKGMELEHKASICHQCSEDLELGDVIDYFVDECE